MDQGRWISGDASEGTQERRTTGAWVSARWGTAVIGGRTGTTGRQPYVATLADAGETPTVSTASIDDAAMVHRPTERTLRTAFARKRDDCWCR